MRHVLANLAVYVLAVGLVAGAALFGWARSQQLIFSTERAAELPEYVVAQAPEQFDWEAFGERVYVANCQNCHTADGSGRAMYPPVRGMGAHLGVEGGRAYLTRVTLYGLASGLHAAPMPPMPNLSDAQVAAVNNYLLTRFDDPGRYDPEVRLYIPAEVAAERGLALSERDMGRRRPAVPVPAALAEGWTGRE
jgi:mono/diheme cytochrome c family protein